MVMKGSIFSILPLLTLLFLAFPAIIPNFAGKLHLVGEKSVLIWGCLKDGIRVGVFLLDFFLSTPVVQVPVFMVVGSGATAYLAQVGIKLINNN